jgi:acyl-CoA thioesterase I
VPVLVPSGARRAHAAKSSTEQPGCAVCRVDRGATLLGFAAPDLTECSEPENMLRVRRLNILVALALVAVFGVIGSSTVQHETRLRLASVTGRRRSGQVDTTTRASLPISARYGTFRIPPRELVSVPGAPPATCAAPSGWTDQTHAADPLLVVVGASFTAGVGAGQPTDAWPFLLGRVLGWRVVARGVPGAGYVRLGVAHRGPLWRELAELRLRRLRPAMVILQAGHNDVGTPPALLRRRVTQIVRTVREDAPHAGLALLTVFDASGTATAADRSTNNTIITAAKSADPAAIIMNPRHWRFPRIADRLHPTPAGHLWIAYRVAELLLNHGVHPDRSGAQAMLEARRLTTLSRRCAAFKPGASLPIERTASAFSIST